MLLAALIDAGADIRAIKSTLHLIPKYYSRCKSINLKTEDILTHGFRACGIELKISEKSREDDHEVSADQFMNATKRITRNSKLSKKAVNFALGSIKMLVEVEGRLHGTGVHETHLHEAGSADTLADVFGVATAMDSLNLFDGEIISAPVAVGGGHVRFSHGTLSIPPPAVMEIVRLHRIPILGGPEPAELATPTGVAMLVNLAQKFSTLYPAMIVEKVGYGSGKIKLNSSPNLLRVVLGTELETISTATEPLQVLETNLDDVSGETLAYTLQKLIEAGAKDAWITFGVFKKNRPGHILHTICDPKDTAELSRIMIQETGTLGVRHQLWHRLTIERQLQSMGIKISGKKFKVKLKLALYATGSIVRVKPEFDDIRIIANEVGLPLRRVEEIVSLRASKKYQ